MQIEQIQVLKGLVFLLFCLAAFFGYKWFCIYNGICRKELKVVIRALKSGTLTDKESGILAREVLKLLNYRQIYKQDIYKFLNELNEIEGFMDEDIINNEDDKIEAEFTSATPVNPDKRKEKLKALIDSIKKDSKKDDKEENTPF
ncbi:hypothetical protein [Candidatus Phytoplasma solani]|uniref:Uncharacterized protein n=1 Tax=Candidatus Phytoplasma solani TaxID=69896 RepID=A0A421NXX8_9MOLU|nr:hypothetical protein [Candidatus Phytoplasma solani]RMI87678.1 hypothetical protein PSSA1_v1c6280 [Candidatus Phytoplasma solani]RMI87767.1 hypothetical protein PSSA1_v1c6020 [Candidatus Phytoplasma solani]RMI88879.1 hypothetical protein PSSA1_v1c3060 [Candidatus Phytoplasma solani]